MKAFAVLALLVAAVSAKPRFSCPADEIVLNIPDDTNCAIFYKCDHGDAVKFNCEAGLIYNPDYEVCDWPYNVKHPGCVGDGGDSTSGPSSSTAAPSSSTAAPSSSTAAPSSSTAPPASSSTAAPSSSTAPPVSSSTAAPSSSTAPTAGTSPTGAPSSPSTPPSGSGTTAIKK